MKILLFPFARKMRNGAPHPKDYPQWAALVNLLTLDGYEVTQVGVEGEVEIVDDFRKNLPLSELSQLVMEYDTWISVDTFGQHLGWHLGKKGIAIFGQSDPLIFGHPENVNLLKDRKYLREKQFWLWEQAEFKEEAFVEPEVVLDAVRSILQKPREPLYHGEGDK